MMRANMYYSYKINLLDSDSNHPANTLVTIKRIPLWL